MYVTICMYVWAVLFHLTEPCLRALCWALWSPLSPDCDCDCDWDWEGNSADFKMPSAFEFRRFVDRKQLPRRVAPDCSYTQHTYIWICICICISVSV